LWKAIWRDDGAQKNGRNGQPQHGVDVYGRPAKGQSWAGIQCKGKENYTNQELTTAEIQSESGKARGFNRRLAEYAIATTAPRDGALQEFARVLTEENMRAGWFSVTVYGWHDIVDLIFEHAPPIAAQFYPQIFGGELTAVAGQILKCLSEHRVSSSPVGEPAVFRREGDAGGIDEHPPTAGTVANKDLAATEVSPADMRSAIDGIFLIHQRLACQARAGGSVSSDASLSQAVTEAVHALDERRLPPLEGSHVC
jgi:hypothetical protein